MEEAATLWSSPEGALPLDLIAVRFYSRMNAYTRVQKRRSNQSWYVDFPGERRGKRFRNYDDAYMYAFNLLFAELVRCS